MGCSSCAARANVQRISQTIQSPQQTQNCDYTKQLIQNWYNSLNCVKLSNKESLIGLTITQVNSYLGYLQSALNYPDNYCYYLVKLQEFQLNILPRIIINVPECSN